MVLLLACSCAAVTAQAAERAVRKYSIDDFMASVDHRGLTFSPDGRTLATSVDDSGVFNIKTIDVASGTVTVRTKSTTQSLLVASYFPNDGRLLYLADDGGDELDHLYVLTADGKSVDLTPGKNLKAEFLSWSADGTKFFVLSNERDPRFFDLYAHRADNYQRQLIYQNDASYSVEAVSADGTRVALGKQIDNARKEVWLWTAGKKEPKRISPEGSAAAETAATFSPDGKQLLITTDAGHEFKHLVAVDLASGNRRVLYKPDWDIWTARYSHDGAWLSLMMVEDARLTGVLLDAKTYARVPLANMPDGSTATFGNPPVVSPDGRTMAYINSDGDTPADIYVHDLTTNKGRRLARSLSPRIDERDLVPGEVVRFKASDAVTIPGVLFKPHQAKAGAKLPAIVWVHGGPGGESWRIYDQTQQYLVNNGYVVYAINNRGSSGSGKTFHHLDDRRHGRDDLRDVVESKRMLVELGYVDPARIGIMGGSYGGFMTLAALAFTPDEFAVGVDVFGVSNWVRTLASIPPWWESMRQYLVTEIGDPNDTATLRSISPLFHAEKIKKPLLVLQGARDPRVLQVESDEIVSKVRANGVPVDYVVFDDEGHGFRKKRNQRVADSRTLEFLDKYLKSRSGE